MKRTPSRVAAQAITALAQELDEQRELLEEIKGLLVEQNRQLTEHRQHTLQAVDDLGARVRQVETRLR